MMRFFRFYAGFTSVALIGTVLVGLSWAVAVRLHGAALGRRRGAIVVGLAVAAALTLLPASLAVSGRDSMRCPFAPLSPSPEHRLARRRRRPGRTQPVHGPGGALAPVGHGPARPVFVVTLLFLVTLGLPFLHVRFNAPDATSCRRRAVAAGLRRRWSSDFPMGDFAPLALAIATDGPVTDPANVGLLYDYSRRIAADPRVVRVEGLVDLDPRLTRRSTSSSCRSARRPGRPVRRLPPWPRTTRRPDGVHRHHAVRANAPRRGPWSRPCATRPQRWRPRPALASWWAVGGGGVRRGGPDGADFPRTALFILVTTYLVLFLLLRSVVLPLKALVMNSPLDPRQLRRPGLDLPGRQPLGAAGLPAAGIRGDDPAGDPVLRPVRPVDGLRGLPAQPHEGGLRPDRATTARPWRAASSAAGAS